MDLRKLLKEEERTEGVKMGYYKFCSRSLDWFWKCELGDNSYDGMILDLIKGDSLSKEEIRELIEDKVLTRDTCCDTYYAIAVY